MSQRLVDEVVAAVDSLRDVVLGRSCLAFSCARG
jgi:hypothetical protein